MRWSLCGAQSILCGVDSMANTVLSPARTKRQVVVAVAVVTNDQGEILLTRRHQPELPDAHGRWEVPGGRVEHGEPAHETARREVLEETGYEIEVDQTKVVVRDYLWKFPDYDAHTILIGHRAKLIGGQRKVEGGKVIDVRWWSREAVPEDNLLALADVFINELLPAGTKEENGSQ